jgi:ribosome-associated protein YbcJ (S4-like RNA binding protein)
MAGTPMSETPRIHTFLKIVGWVDTGVMAVAAVGMFATMGA